MRKLHNFHENDKYESRNRKIAYLLMHKSQENEYAGYHRVPQLENLDFHQNIMALIGFAK
jgi:hypothetical protein